MSIEILRTPDAAFEGLPHWPFAPRYETVDGVRIAYVDEGRGPVIFLLHGQPTWSYLYRHMIPVLADAGYRVIAPDLVGFGRSDKPVDPAAHTFGAHVRWMDRFVRRLGITGAAAFVQDWGGMIALRVLAEHPDWLSRLVVANTALADPGPLGRALMPLAIRGLTALSGRATIEDLEQSLSFRHWLAYFHRSPTLELGRVVQALSVRGLSPAEAAAYDAPFPDPSFAAGPRRMPTQVATEMDAAHRAWESLAGWPHPVLTLFSDRDPFLAGTPFEEMFQDRFGGAAGQPHHTTTDASHFLQEDKGPELAGRIVGWLRATHFAPQEAA